MFEKNRLSQALVAVGAFAASGLAMADPAADPTAGIVTTLGTYAADVGLLAAAVLLIFYGKKLVSYLRV